MSEFVSLFPSGLSKNFNPEEYSEKPIISLEEKKDSIEIDYVFPGFTMGNNEQQVDDQTLAFKEIGISGAGFISESGKPLIPSFGRFVQIPPGFEFEVTVQKNKPVLFDDILITPAQEQATDQAAEPSEFEYSTEAYSHNSLYPAEVVQIGEPQNMDDYKVLAIHVRPLQYNPAKKQVSGFSNIKITISLTPLEKADADMEEFPLIDPPTNREGFGNLVLNPRRSITERIPIPHRPPVLTIPRGPEFLIIYDDTLKSAAERLADWKNHKGLLTEIVSISTVGNSVDKIKKYIRKRRNFFFSRLRYVLLFGDINAIAIEEVGGNTTDFYYFTKKDPANANDCLLPTISGGRIPVDSLDDANAVVEQIINYEKTPPCDSDYYNRMTFAAYFQDDGPQDGQADRAYMKTMEGIREHMISIGFSVDRVYVSNNPNPQRYKDGSVIPTEVLNAIVNGDDATEMLLSATSEGQLIVGHRDHGGEDGWVHPRFSRNHLKSILSAYPSIFYSINCRTGRFDFDPQDSFAEDLMELKGGAPSLIAPTEYSGTWRNDSLMKALFDAVWPGVIASFPGSSASYAIKYNRLGDILNYAKSYLLLAHGTNNGVKSHFEMYHVIGDPTLQIWAEEPSPIRLRTFVRRNTLHIHISPSPAEAVITIWYKNKAVKRSAVTSNRISIPLKDLRLKPGRIPSSRASLDVCVSAPGHRYTHTRVRL